MKASVSFKCALVERRSWASGRLWASGSWILHTCFLGKWLDLHKWLDLGAWWALGRRQTFRTMWRDRGCISTGVVTDRGVSGASTTAAPRSASSRASSSSKSMNAWLVPRWRRYPPTLDDVRQPHKAPAGNVWVQSDWYAFLVIFGVCDWSITFFTVGDWPNSTCCLLIGSQGLPTSFAMCNC